MSMAIYGGNKYKDYRTKDFFKKNKAYFPFNCSRTKFEAFNVSVLIYYTKFLLDRF